MRAMIKEMWSDAIGSWGWLVAVVAVVAALAIANWIVNPVEEAVDHIGEPVAGSLGFTSGLCPDGWNDVSDTANDTLQRSCERGEWLVVLTRDGDFDYGLGDNQPAAVYDSAAVPGWPR